MKKIIVIFCFVIFCFVSFCQVPFFFQNFESDTNTTIEIGDQTWMKYNLNVTTLNDGTPISNVTGNTEWSNLTTPGYCWYSNNYETYGSVYGALYNWYTVETGKLCPEDYHVPTNQEWNDLVTFLGGSSSAGGKLKETGLTHWASPNTGATDEYGFTSLPAGYRGNSGPFSKINEWGTFWTSTEFNSLYSYLINTLNGTAEITINTYIFKEDGRSVRCIKN